MQPVKRQLEAALAEVERSSRSGGYDAMRRYLQLVSMQTTLLRKLGYRMKKMSGPINPHDRLQVRELKVRDSENVALLGSKLLKHHRSKLQTEECECFHRACSQFLTKHLPS